MSLKISECSVELHLQYHWDCSTNESDEREAHNPFLRYDSAQTAANEALVLKRTHAGSQPQVVLLLTSNIEYQCVPFY